MILLQSLLESPVMCEWGEQVIAERPTYLPLKCYLLSKFTNSNITTTCVLDNRYNTNNNWSKKVQKFAGVLILK